MTVPEIVRSVDSEERTLTVLNRTEPDPIFQLLRDVGEGELHSGFQRLSRIDDESGTREVYEALTATDLEVHAYGVPDWDPDLPLRAQGVDNDETRRSWFVAFDPPRDESRKVALVAYKPELGNNEWEAFWTHDRDRVDDLLDTLRERYVYGTPAGPPGT